MDFSVGVETSGCLAVDKALNAVMDLWSPRTGFWVTDARNEDSYRGLSFRFFMPANSPRKVNCGLGAHWTGWARALACCADVFYHPKCRMAALDQLHWLLGTNPFRASFVSGIGYNNPMPYSRPFGHIVGGFMNGPRGNARDEIFADTGGHCDWSTCE